MEISPALARQLLDAAPDASVVSDVDGHIIYANARIEDVLGYSPAELIGRDVETLVPERVRAKHAGLRSGYSADPSPRPMGSGLQLHGLHKAGHEIPVEISLSPVSTAQGMLVSFAIRDVAAQRELERQLTEASRAKSRFLAAASHDLRQPIQTLNFLNAAARRNTIDRVHLEIIEKQQRSLDSMGRLLNSILDVSRLEAGIVKPDITDFAVREVVEDLRLEFEEQAREKGLDLIIEPCDAIARSDSRLFAQILENLISNAIRYTQDGYVRLHCLREKLRVRFQILDTGLGIAPLELDRIFEEFYQVDNGKKPSEGLGLGLSIVKHTAELIGCDVTVSSEVGKGSVFSVSLPIGDRRRLASVDGKAVRTPERVGGLVLVLDDEPDVAEITGLLLSLEGFEISTANSDLEAVDKAAAQAPDLLLIDYHLRGGANGVDAIRAIRERAGSEIPAILVSGDTSDTVPSALPGNSTLLIKPVAANVLLSEIRERIRPSKGRAAG
jgi:PAS domain S-box-containing protein